jgi:hypothetical protein
MDKPPFQEFRLKAMEHLISQNGAMQWMERVKNEPFLTRLEVDSVATKLMQDYVPTKSMDLQTYLEETVRDFETFGEHEQVQTQWDYYNYWKTHSPEKYKHLVKLAKCSNR